MPDATAHRWSGDDGPGRLPARAVRVLTGVHRIGEGGAGFPDGGSRVITVTR
ncbi:hypothetical protein ABZ700_00085 [Streptomyces diastaticus]|uniref:hypothetical protein n=1 Tax=Streptomyces diastaticus TaxID=1956 RepID=UPI0033EE993E